MGILSWLGGKGPTTSRPADLLDLELCRFSGTDPFTLRDACEGVQVFGATGSGKSSGSGAALARSYLAAGFGGLVMTVKPEDRALWERYAGETGRSDDLIIFGPGSPWRFDPLNYELTRAGAGAGITHNVVELFMLGLEAGGRSKQSGSDSSFWNDTTKEMLRNDVDLVASATGSVSLTDLYDVIESAPLHPDQVHDERWQRESICFACLEAAERNATSPAKRGDYQQTERYWLKRFPQLAEKTRSIIVTSFTAMADALLRDPMRPLFCEGTNLPPEASLAGKIILLDMPVKEFGETGVFAQVLFKLSWQKAMERRDYSRSKLPVFLWADECQYFLTAYDQLFQTTARSSLACTVYLTQNLPNYYAAFGEGKGKSQADSLLGNLQTKIFHCNGDSITNEWASKLIAQVWQNKTSITGGASINAQGESENNGFSFAEQLAAQVLPVEFTTLKKGGRPNGNRVDAIAFQSGRIWDATGTNFLRTSFQQT